MGYVDSPWEVALQTNVKKYPPSTQVDKIAETECPKDICCVWIGMLFVLHCTDVFVITSHVGEPGENKLLWLCEHLCKQ